MMENFVKHLAPQVISYPAGKCRYCGCTDDDCRQCIEAQGEPCHWTDDSRTVCSRCLIKPAP